MKPGDTGQGDGRGGDVDIECISDSEEEANDALFEENLLGKRTAAGGGRGGGAQGGEQSRQRQRR